jgi:Ser/Thr protein kinase RdoA (MazF antagonist)
MRDEVIDYAERVLGPCELVRDHSWAHQMSSVLRLRDANGTHWFVKQHADRDRYEAEVQAYCEWVPALGSNAPSLRAVDDGLAAIILTSVPAEPAPWPALDASALSGADRQAEQTLQCEAGRLLRRLHDAKGPLQWDDFGAAKIEEFARLQPHAARWVSTRVLALARREVARLDGYACPGRVPCHRDYTPRNWLVGDGVQYVIDFEWARLDVWISDLARLHIGIWADRPDLRDAFMAGYGREVSEADRAILHGCAVLTAVWQLAKADETRQRSFVDGSRKALLRLLRTND